MARSGTKPAVGRPASAGARRPGRPWWGAPCRPWPREGFAGASAREIARRAGCNQGLVFYHFGSVANLLLAALDEVSETRRVRYQAAVDRANGVGELVDAAAAIFEEDLDAGHMAVLAEMIAGASSTPGLAHRGRGADRPVAPVRRGGVARRVWTRTPLAAVVEPDVAAHAVVALYLGLELLAHLDGDRSPALALFDRARQLAAVFETFGAAPEQEEEP